MQSISTRRISDLITRFAISLCLFASFGAGLSSTASAQNPITVTNVFENHYAYDFPISPAALACPTGYNIDSSRYASAGFHLERGHAIHHLDPQNAANDYWVYWAHFENSNYGTAEVAVFKSTTECGPYTLQTNLYTGTTPSNVTDPNMAYNTDGFGYGFRPGGWESRDEIIFRDANTQTYNPNGTVASYASAYLYTASNSLNTIPNNACGYANDSIAAFKLTPDYMGIDTTTSAGTNGANWIFPCAQREAPVLFRAGSYYFLVVSQAAGWYPSQGAYGSSSNPLTGFPAAPLTLGNSSTFGGQTSDGFTIAGSQATSYFLVFDHLGGDDSKNPSYNSLRDSGGVVLPLALDGNTGTATLSWEPSFTIDTTSGVLTLPSLPNLAVGSTATATTYSGTNNPASYAIDGNYFTRWAAASSAGTSSLTTGNASFNASTTKTSTLCPITNAISSTTCNPSLVVDLGSVQPVQEVDLSWNMIKGSEPYYNFKLAYSSDNIIWNTLDYTAYAPGSNATAANISAIPFSNDVTYGFNSLPVNFSARYVALIETQEVVQNNSPGNYGPSLYEMAVIQSTTPASPQPVTVTVAPGSSTTSPTLAIKVNVSVSGPSGQPAPSGYIQLSAPGYTSDTYGLVKGANTFTIPAGVLTGGSSTLSVAYRPDPTSAPVYGIGTTTGTAPVYVSAPDTPTNLTLKQSAPGSIVASWTASTGALSYVVSRSTDGGATFTQVGTATTTRFTDTGLANDSVNYCYTLAAVNAAGPSMPTSPVCSPATAKFPVTGITVVQTSPGALTIAYNAIANVTGYSIKRSVNSGAYTPLTTTTATSYTDSGLSTGSYICYTVAAVFSSGAVADSAPLCAAVTSGFAPLGLAVARSGNGMLTLTWTSSSTTATTYVVKRSVNGGAYAALASGVTAPTYTDLGLTNYTSTYCYVVDAVLNGVISSDSIAACNFPIFFITIPNFGFEAPSTNSYIYSPPSSTALWSFAGSSGSFASGSGVTTNGSPFTGGNGVAPQGTQVAFLQGVGSATQIISGLTQGHLYQFTVAAAQRQDQYGVQLGNPFNVNLNGTAIVTITPPQSSSTYADYSATFTAPSPSVTLQLAGTNGRAIAGYTDNTVFVDNVRISVLGAGTAAITVQPMIIAQGTAYTVLTASQSYSGSAPKGSLIFQVDGSDQVPGSCTVGSAQLTCTATYATGSLATGARAISVSYLGDDTYAGSTGTATLTVNDASTGYAQLITSTSLTKLANGNYQAVVTVQNTGTTTAAAATLTSLVLGSASGSPVPASLGDIAPGGTVTTTITVPSSAGVHGAAVVERIRGTYTGGTFGTGIRTQLP